MWSYDFVSDSTEEGRPLRNLTLINEYSRECMPLMVWRQESGYDVCSFLRYLFINHGIREYSHYEKGQEVAGKVLRQWLENIR